MTRLTNLQRAELRAWLRRNRQMIAQKKLWQREAAELASKELGFTITKSHIGYIATHEPAYAWPHRGGNRGLTADIVAAQPIIQQPNGHKSIVAQLKELSALVRSFDNRLRRLEEVVG